MSDTIQVRPFLAGFSEIMCGAALFAPGATGRAFRPTPLVKFDLRARVAALAGASEAELKRGLDEIEADLCRAIAADERQLRQTMIALATGQLSAAASSVALLTAMIAMSGDGIWPWLIGGAWAAIVILSAYYWGRNF